METPSTPTASPADNTVQAPAEKPLMAVQEQPAPESVSAAEVQPKVEAAQKPLMAVAGDPAPVEQPDNADPKPEDQPKAPENYEAFKLPDGFKLDEAANAKAVEYFKSMNYTQEQAQQAVDIFCEVQKENAVKSQARTNQTVQAWRGQIESRPNFKDEVPLVQAGIRGMVARNPDIGKLYNDPVFGNMPELWDIAVLFGKYYETEGAPPDKGGGQGNKSLADVLYTSMPKK